MAVFAICASAQVTKSSDSRPIGAKAKTQPKVVKTGSVSSLGSGASRTFTATAYSLRGRMFNGERVHQGAIAADPRVLPIGTVVYIEGMGQFVVKDTGRLIKGNRIDIWVPSRAKAIAFGRRPVKLKIISMPKRK